MTRDPATIERHQSAAEAARQMAAANAGRAGGSGGGCDLQPVRQRAARLANRVVYGRRASPYQVLSDFAHRIGGTYASEDVLPQMAQIVAAGTGAERVVVWLRVDDELRPEASSRGSPGAVSLPVDGNALPPLPGADLSVPVVHQGDLLGAISIRMPKDEPLRPAGEQLVADVASQASLVLSNAGLIEDLRASRERLVTAQDEASGARRNTMLHCVRRWGRL